MKAIFKIEFVSEWSGVPQKKKHPFTTEDLSYSETDDVKVLVDGDAEKAIAKTRAWALKRVHDLELQNDDDKEYTVHYACTGFSLRSVVLVTEAEESDVTLTPEEQKVADDFRELFYRLGPEAREGTVGTWARTYWFGTRILKNPFDLWLYQELIGVVQPDLIVECGTGAGASAYYFASLCSLIDKGQIVTIDIADPHYPNMHPRITYLNGSSVDTRIVELVRARAIGEKTMVILDSDHSYAHVSLELETYADLVSPGNYLVVEDTNLPETKAAALDFVAKHPEFEIDREQEKFLMTFNTYLRRKNT